MRRRANQKVTPLKHIVLPYIAARRKRLQLVLVQERIQFLRKNPQDVNEDDLDMLVDVDGRSRRWLLHEQPDIARQYEEYRDTPEKITSTLASFMRRAWKHANIPQAYSENWHHKILCDDFTDLANSDLFRLFCSVPPGCTKSLISGGFFPAWRWAINPSECFWCGGYSVDIPRQSGAAFRALINSQWYQKRWGHKFGIKLDNVSEMTNTRGGYRRSSAIPGKLTGKHPDYLLLDDPNEANDVNYPAKMDRVHEWYSNTVSTRGATKDSKIGIIAQRIGINDLTGFLLGEMQTDEDLSDFIQNDNSRFKFRHTCLPMRFDPAHPYLDPRDPRTVKDELLWPALLPEDRVEDIRKNISRKSGPHVADAQLQQQPRMAGNRLFRRLDQCMVEEYELPILIAQGRAVRAWDRAGTADGGDWTAGVLLVEFENRRFVVDVQRVRLDPARRDDFILQVARLDRARLTNYRVANEVMPGPDGKQVHRDLALRIRAQVSGTVCMAADTGGKSKVERAAPAAFDLEAGNTFVVAHKKWTFTFMQELSMFPQGANDDQVDAFAHAHHSLNKWHEEK